MTSNLKILCKFYVELVQILIWKWFRVQNTVVFMNKEWPGYPAVICQNLICVGAGVLCAIYYDRVSPCWYQPIWLKVSVWNWKLNFRLGIWYDMQGPFVQQSTCISYHVSLNSLMKRKKTAKSALFQWLYTVLLFYTELPILFYNLPLKLTK